MPLIDIITNRKESDLQDGIEERIVKAVAQALNKPTERCIVSIITGARMYRQGSTEPSLSCQIRAIGVFDAEKNPQYGQPILKVLQEEFNLSKERCGVVFIPLEFHQIAT